MTWALFFGITLGLLGGIYIERNFDTKKITKEFKPYKEKISNFFDKFKKE
jgi:hypothetical protein